MTKNELKEVGQYKIKVLGENGSIQWKTYSYKIRKNDVIEIVDSADMNDDWHIVDSLPEDRYITSRVIFEKPPVNKAKLKELFNRLIYKIINLTNTKNEYARFFRGSNAYNAPAYYILELSDDTFIYINMNRKNVVLMKGSGEFNEKKGFKGEILKNFGHMYPEFESDCTEEDLLQMIQLIDSFIKKNLAL